MKVTGVPVQTEVAEGETVRLTGRIGLTVITTGALVAGLPVTQMSEEVSSQVTISPFCGA